MLVSIVAVAALKVRRGYPGRETAILLLVAPFSCSLLGHRYRFVANGATMRWSCGRCGAPGGAKEYASAEDAARYAAAFDREDRDDLGRRAPLVGLFPLRLWRAWRSRG
jgi:hypothetical protein